MFVYGAIKQEIVKKKGVLKQSIPCACIVRLMSRPSFIRRTHTPYCRSNASLKSHGTVTCLDFSLSKFNTEGILHYMIYILQNSNIVFHVAWLSFTPVLLKSHHQDIRLHPTQSRTLEQNHHKQTLPDYQSHFRLHQMLKSEINYVCFEF